MGFFETLGQRVERVKQTVSSDASYGCTSCEESLPENYDICPHCGSETVVSLD
jgi:rRNA maturation endonuclease Nob1